MPTPRRRQRSTTRADFQAESQVSLPLLDLIAAADLVAPAESLDASSAQSATIQVHLKAQTQTQTQPQTLAQVQAQASQVHSQLQAKAHARAKKRSQAQIKSTHAESQVPQLAQKSVPVSAQALTLAQAQVQVLSQPQSQAQAQSQAEAMIKVKAISQYESANRAEHKVEGVVKSKVKGEANVSDVAYVVKVDYGAKKAKKAEKNKQDKLTKAESYEEKGRCGDSFSVKVSTEEVLKVVEKILGPQGEMGIWQPDFKFREGQLSLSKQVARSLNSDSFKVQLLEAGTGIGKTYAYLIPLLILRKRALISTATNFLQNQLALHDIPQLLKGLGLQNTVSFTQIMGVHHYFCHVKLDQVLCPELALENFQLYCNRRIREAQETNNVVQQDYWRKRLANGQQEIEQYRTSMLQGLRHALDFEQLSNEQVELKLQGLLDILKSVRQALLEQDDELLSTKRPDHLPAWFGEIELSALRIAQSKGLTPQQIALYDQYVGAMQRFLSCESLDCPYCPLNNGDSSYKCWYRLSYKCAYFSDVVVINHALLLFEVVPSSQISTLVFQQQNLQDQLLSEESETDEQAQSQEQAPESLFCSPSSESTSDLALDPASEPGSEPSHERVLAPASTLASSQAPALALSLSSDSGQAQVLSLSSSSGSSLVSAPAQAQSKAQECAPDKSNEHPTENLRDKTKQAANEKVSGEVNADKGESNAQVKGGTKGVAKSKSKSKSKTEAKNESFTEYLCNQLNQDNFGKVTGAVSQISRLPSKVVLDEAKIVDTTVVVDNEPTQVQAQVTAKHNETSKIRAESSSGIGVSETAFETCAGTDAQVSAKNGLNSGLASGAGADRQACAGAGGTDTGSANSEVADSGAIGFGSGSGLASASGPALGASACSCSNSKLSADAVGLGNGDGAVSLGTVAGTDAQDSSQAGTQMVWQLRTSQERDFKSERLGIEAKRERIRVAFGENLQENLELGLLLMQRQALVIDEAHALESTMRQSFSTEFTSEKLLALLKELKMQGLPDGNLGALITAFGSLQPEQCRDKPDGIALSKLLSTQPQLLQKIRDTRDQLKNLERFILFNPHKSYELWRIRSRVQKLIYFLHCMYNLQHNFTRMAGSLMLYADRATFTLDAPFSFKANIQAPAPAQAPAPTQAQVPTNTSAQAQAMTPAPGQAQVRGKLHSQLDNQGGLQSATLAETETETEAKVKAKAEAHAQFQIKGVAKAKVGAEVNPGSGSGGAGDGGVGSTFLAATELVQEWALALDHGLSKLEDRSVSGPGNEAASGVVSGAVVGQVSGSSNEVLAHQDKFNVPLLMQTGETQADVAVVKRRRGRPRKVVASLAWSNGLGVNEGVVNGNWANEGGNNQSEINRGANTGNHGNGNNAALAQVGANSCVTPGAQVTHGAQVTPGTQVTHGAQVMSGAKVTHGTHVEPGAYVAHELYRFKLKLTPLNLADYGRMLFTVLQECNCVPILTSATLRIAEKLSMSNRGRNISRRYTIKDGVNVVVSNFNTLKRHIGLEPVHTDRLRISGALGEAFLSYVPVEQMVVDSPFDFAHRSLVWCSSHFAAANDEHGPDIEARRRNLKGILSVINSNPGSTLILVSSFQLVDVYKQLIQEQHPDWQLFCQNRHENLESTVQRFKAYQASKHTTSCVGDFNPLQNSCAPDSLRALTEPTESAASVKSAESVESLAPAVHPEPAKSAETTGLAKTIGSTASTVAPTAHHEGAELSATEVKVAKLSGAEVGGTEFGKTKVVGIEVGGAGGFDKPAILIGTDSCWTGLNLKGSGLHVVVIDKLPFTPIGCLEQQHSDHLRSFTYFNYERLPKALARLKQGIGRLIRAEQDWGVVILATPFQTKRYAPLVYKTLEPMPWVETTDPQIVLQFMRKFSTTS